MVLKKDIDVLGLGAVTVDFLGVIDHWVSEGSKKSLEQLEIHDGGLVGTALVAVARLGGKAAFVGKLGYSEEELELLVQLVDRFAVEGERRQESICMGYIARIYKEMGKIDAAIKVLDKNLHLIEKDGIEQDLCFNLVLKAQIHFEQGMTESAFAFCDKAERLARRMIWLKPLCQYTSYAQIFI